jgi:cold shock CspA family protein
MGTVARLFPERDHGFITSSDGREIYFHRTNVTGAGFDSLSVGNVIHYIEEKDDPGPQASIVYP